MNVIEKGPTSLTYCIGPVRRGRHCGAVPTVLSPAVTDHDLTTTSSPCHRYILLRPLWSCNTSGVSGTQGIPVCPKAEAATPSTRRWRRRTTGSDARRKQGERRGPRSHLPAGLRVNYTPSLPAVLRRRAQTPQNPAGRPKWHLRAKSPLLLLSAAAPSFIRSPYPR